MIAGAGIQYLADICIDRHNRKAVLSDLRTEAKYNLGVAKEILDEVAKFRAAAAQPDTFAGYLWTGRSGNMLATALNEIVNSRHLYKILMTENSVNYSRYGKYLLHNMNN